MAQDLPVTFAWERAAGGGGLLWSPSHRSGVIRIALGQLIPHRLRMARVVYLRLGEERPRSGDEDEPWLIIDCTHDGLFFGTGSGWREDGEHVNYISLPENDVSLDRALAAAQEWAERRGVSTIYVYPSD